jgi:hypothetical protein
MPVIKPIWFGAFQPCGTRLHALLPEWLPAYEQDHHRIDSDVRGALLGASPRTLNRLLQPLRAAARRRGGTRPVCLFAIRTRHSKGSLRQPMPADAGHEHVAIQNGTDHLPPRSSSRTFFRARRMAVIFCALVSRGKLPS